MISSLHRIITIARNTLTGIRAQESPERSAHLRPGSGWQLGRLFATGHARSSIPRVSSMPRSNSVKGFRLRGDRLVRLFHRLLSTAELIRRNCTNRTIYTILAKPVRRSEFLLGKFLGVVLLLALCVALMSLAFAATLYWQELQGLKTTDAAYAQSSNWQAIRSWSAPTTTTSSRSSNRSVTPAHRGDHPDFCQAGDDHWQLPCSSPRLPPPPSSRLSRLS